MITSIARQSLVLKCLRQKSILLGNYEFYYLSGLMTKLFNLNLSENLKPNEMLDEILKNIDSLEPKDDYEKYLIKLVSIYLADEEYNDEMKLLFRWGVSEEEIWQVTTTHKAEEYQ